MFVLKGKDLNMLPHERLNNVGMTATGLRNPWKTWLKEIGVSSRKILISVVKVEGFQILFATGEKQTCLKSCWTSLMKLDTK